MSWLTSVSRRIRRYASRILASSWAMRTRTTTRGLWLGASRGGARPSPVASAARAFPERTNRSSWLRCINTSAVNGGRGKVPAYGRDVFKEPSAPLKGLLKEIEGVTLCSWAQRGSGLGADRGGETALE